MMKPASRLDFNRLEFFSAHEWPEGVLEHMNANIIVAANNLRRLLPRDHFLIPSDIPEAHVRHEGVSRHSTQGGQRLSDATDVFARWSTVWTIWMAALRMDFGGIGIYMDTVWNGVSRPMLHFDLRPARVLWVRSHGKYIYYHSNPVAFHRVLGNEGKV